MSGDLSTPTRVRNRLGFADISLTDAILQEYIDDAQAYLESFTRRSYTSIDDDYQLAVSVTTDLAAIYAIVRPAGGSTEGITYQIDELTVKKDSQLRLKLQTAAQFQIKAREGLASLRIDTADLPFSSDQVGL